MKMNQLALSLLEKNNSYNNKSTNLIFNRNNL